MSIIVDKDYEISGIENGSLRFVERFIQQLSFRLVGMPVKVRNENGVIKATIKHPDSRILNLYGRVSMSSTSKEIQIADVVLGCYLKDGKAFDENKVIFRKLIKS